MRRMFSTGSDLSINSDNVHNWDVSNVTNMDIMFKNYNRKKQYRITIPYIIFMVMNRCNKSMDKNNNHSLYNFSRGTDVLARHTFNN